MENRLYQTSDVSRFVPEDKDEETWRDAFRRDYARVIHSPSFRRQQGKTQIFPGHESDFFRNRLTHSLEVAQIAESIAHRLNATSEFLTNNPIDPRICFTAAHLHDIGHPPFGHNGEEALDECMRKYGGFEGNAQTLRIVSQLEKKRYRPGIEDALERRAGLNLTYRTLAAILKYDDEIAEDRSKDTKIRKGYYFCDKEIVQDIKRSVCPGIDFSKRKFKTIECQIMDIADDIAYSTYDIEDTFKAGFLCPSTILTYDSSVMDAVAEEVSKKTGDAEFSASGVLGVFLDIFSQLVIPTEDLSPGVEDSIGERVLAALTYQHDLDSIAQDGNLRTSFTSYLVGRFISGVQLQIDEELPQLSQVSIEPNTFQEIEVLKNFTYQATIRSNRVAVSEFRGKDIVRELFEALDGKKGRLLLPDDFQKLYDAAEGNVPARKRVLCDFIAGMTDRYAMEFWARLYSDTGETIFKPL
ncbi:anti-phage deoxyguanosine triphosphatase [Parasphingopyxis marina]|uniref:Deoxyguanosinetriphosphate triphosphohydrolase-like protein n=1 Tax=Parasphingopyxis marina TaxID=2761622 RepID=A0A842HV39_9SPHN|nr:anti-phage deoxyguanosine triphosphatase [Parasphingopyxis marina]MBC2776383.1 dNTP triphosphohydrolase [Parasphingopyxis marina]